VGGEAEVGVVLEAALLFEEECVLLAKGHVVEEGSLLLVLQALHYFAQQHAADNI
jgi:hypothetical protein